MPVFLLNKEEISFPHPEYAREDGLLAVGGDLSVERLLLAYDHGIFPWFNPEDEILWWCPRERFIIPPSEVHISRSMQKFFRKHKIYVEVNRDFRDTMHRSRLVHQLDEGGTWISDDMEEAYTRLYDLGYAMSLEAFIDDKLAGGLYGVFSGSCFVGESMFSTMENGSKVALIVLAQMLERSGFTMIDCQLHTDHLESMGGRYISWEEYMEKLHQSKNVRNSQTIFSKNIQ